jgi:1-acyl-sn-glycerol-3-phosphate acyltransferase
MRKEFQPFVRTDQPNWDWLELIKCVVLIPLGLVRLLICSLIFLAAYFIACVTNSLPARFCSFASRIVLFLLGFFWIKMEDKSRLHNLSASSPKLIVCNHLSYLDMLILVAFCGGDVTFVSKENIGKACIFGTISKAMGCIYVPDKNHTRTNEPREGGEASTSQEIVNYLRGTGSRKILVIFPEGTTSNGHQLLSFRRGAFVPGVPIQPFTVVFPHDRFNPSWETYEFIPHLLHLVCQVYNNATLTKLPVYYPSAEDLANIDVFKSNVQTLMAGALMLPIVDVSIKDKVAYHKYLIQSVFPRGLYPGFWLKPHVCMSDALETLIPHQKISENF